MFAYGSPGADGNVRSDIIQGEGRAGGVDPEVDRALRSDAAGELLRVGRLLRVRQGHRNADRDRGEDRPRPHVQLQGELREYFLANFPHGGGGRSFNAGNGPIFTAPHNATGATIGAAQKLPFPSPRFNAVAPR